MGEIVDGQYQKYAVESGAYMREHFWGADPRLLDMVKHLSDDQLKKMTLGGHDPIKVYNAYKAAVEHKGAPTVILARTIKGYGLGEAGEGKNITHQQKKMNEDELRAFRTRFGIPDLRRRDRQDAVLPPDRRQRRNQVHARAPRARSAATCRRRKVRSEPLTGGPDRALRGVLQRHRRPQGLDDDGVRAAAVEAAARQGDRPSSSCRSCPTRRAPSAWRRCSAQVGIYSHAGQLYEPVDMDTLLYYKEASDGQILEEGITEAGSMSSFIAAGTAYATHGVNTIPFFIYYSMFGFQRIGDLIWAAADARTRGFLLGGTAGRTTLAGEGLQHQDGNSQLLALAGAEPASATTRRSPTRSRSSSRTASAGCTSISESVFYYLTVMNEQYAMPAMPEGARDGILKGLYRFRAPATPKRDAARAAVRQRRDPARSDQGAGDARIEVRRRAPTCGASPATASCIATATRASAGTCCTRARRRACRT